MAVAYPGALPLLTFANLRMSRAQNVVRSPTDSGAAKQRRRFTNATRSYTDRAVFTETELITFDSFYYDTLFAGTIAFDHPDPIFGGTVECRFDASQPPTWNLLSHSSSPDRVFYEGTLVYEILG